MDIYNDLERLKRLLDNGAITQEERELDLSALDSFPQIAIE